MTAESILKKPGRWSKLGDRINPIVVKELRQAVQSRFVVAALLTMLAIQIVAVGIYLMASGTSLLGFDAGRQAFLMLFGILQVIGMLFVPLYTAVRLAAERSDTNVDLLFITTIKPRAIIAGKLFAAITLTALIFSACMPFMAFTYFLRGIDLPSIFLTLAFGFAVVITCTQAAVFVACVPVNRALKVIFGLIAMIIFGIAFIAMMGGATSLVNFGVSGTGFWQGMIILGAVILFLIGLFFALSVALIMPVASNRALPVRLFITVTWLLTGAAALIDGKIEKSHEPLSIWLVLFEILLAVAIFAAVSERDQPGRRVLRSISKSTFKRVVSFFFFSGAANGLAWVSLLIVTTLAIAWACLRLFPSYRDTSGLVDSAKWMGGMCLYVYCYALTGALLRRRILSRIGTELTWLVSGILLTLGSVVPPLIGFIVFSNDRPWADEFGMWFVGNPFAWSNKSYRGLYASVGGVWAVLVTAMNLLWFIERAKNFRPAARLAANESFDTAPRAMVSEATTTTD